jgi:hypothetical protein
MAKYATPTKTSNVLPAGGGRKTRWGVLADDSDSDRSLSPPPAPRKPLAGRPAFCEPLPSPSPHSPVRDAASMLRAFCETDPVFMAMERGDLLWGDIVYEPVAAVPRRAPSPPRRRAIRFADEVPESEREARALEAAWDAAEHALWQQPFAEKLECPFTDYFDLTGLDDAEYETFMRYIYANGFHVEEHGRSSCYAVPSTEEPRVWQAPGRFAGLAGGCCGHHHAPAPKRAAMAAPGTDVGRRKGAPVPRFCRAAGACADEGCRYVHGDTIQRVNLPCNFGEGCGASDPTGVKRSQCLRMHPGEEWTEGLVITRIV